MNQELLFYMWQRHRRLIIEKHDFLFHQARSLLLSQFDNLDELAVRETQAWLHRIAQHYHSEDDDPATYYEQAYERGIDYFLQLSSIYETTKLSVLTMIFVEMDKELRGWMASELGRWRHDGELVSKVWTRRLVEIYDLLEACGWNSRKASFMNLLHQCQLVVNVYKHGHGNSLHELKADYPQYLTSKTEEELYLDIDFLDHAQLHVEMHQLIAFSDGIVDFWESIPERLFLDYTADFPVWFVKAWNHDTSE